MNYKNKIGNFGQQLAGHFFQKRQYKILEQNYQQRSGEIDLILEKDGQIVFAEVKTRLSENFGLPEEAIDSAKKEKIYQTGLQYLAEKGIEHDNFRIDCLAIVIDKAKKRAIIRHHKNIR